MNFRNGTLCLFAALLFTTYLSWRSTEQELLQLKQYIQQRDAEIKSLQNYYSHLNKTVSAWQKEKNELAADKHKTEQAIANELQSNKEFENWSSVVIPVIDMRELLKGSGNQICNSVP